MAGRLHPVDLELTILSARDLKNVNWRYGGFRPYVVAWVDPRNKVSIRVDPEGDTDPSWNEKITIPILNRPLQDAELTLEIVHDKPSELTKPPVATARIPLAQVLEEVGFDERFERTLKLKRPSARPQGKLDILICLREKRWPEPEYPQPYGTRGYAIPAYPPPQYAYANPQAGNPYPYAQPNSYPGTNPKFYGASYYDEFPPVGSSRAPYSGGSAAPAPNYAQPEKPKSSKFGLGTGLTVGAVGGLLGGLLLDEVIHHEEDKIEDRAAENVEDDLVYDDDDE